MTDPVDLHIPDDRERMEDLAHSLQFRIGAYLVAVASTDGRISAAALPPGVTATDLLAGDELLRMMGGQLRMIFCVGTQLWMELQRYRDQAAAVRSAAPRAAAMVSRRWGSRARIREGTEWARPVQTGTDIALTH